MVDDPQAKAARAPVRLDSDPGTRGTVADGVGQQIRDHLLEQVGLTADDDGTDVVLDRDIRRLGGLRGLLGGHVDHRLEIDLMKARWADRERPRIGQERLAEPLDPGGPVADRGDRPGRFRVGIAFEGGVGLEQDRMHRREHLVGQVGVEPGLLVAGLLEPVEHGVERRGHAGDLRVGHVQVEPLVKPAASDSVRRASDRPQRPQQPAEQQPKRAEENRQDDGQRRDVERCGLPFRRPQHVERGSHEQERMGFATARGQPHAAVFIGPDPPDVFQPARIPGEIGRQVCRGDEPAVRIPDRGEPGKIGRAEAGVGFGGHEQPEQERRPAIACQADVRQGQVADLEGLGGE